MSALDILNAGAQCRSSSARIAGWMVEVVKEELVVSICKEVDVVSC